MHHAHAPRVGFRRKQAILHQLLGKEYHVVHAAIEKASKGFAQRILRLDNRLVVPYNNGMTIKPQRPKQDDGFDA